MVTYQYLCLDDGIAEVRLPMGAASATISCPECGSEARRVFSSPMLSTGGDPTARKLIDATKATSDQPAVVSSIPSGGKPARQKVSGNPLHQRLPKP